MAPSSNPEAVYQVRPAAPGDCPGLARVQVDNYRAAYAGFFPPAYIEHFTYQEQEQDWRDLLTAGGDDILLAALSPAGEVVGYILARAQADIHPGYAAEIVALHVHPQQRRQGIGAALLRAALLELQARGCPSVMLWTLEGNPTRGWYERLAGKQINQKSYDVDGWEVREVAYGWHSLSTLLEHM